MRFLHTADWQIGMKAAHVGAVGGKVRDERLQAAQRVVSLAAEQQAEFIVIAGDTFEDNAVDRLLVQKVADILAKTSVPVYLISGNHDPLVAGSVWEHPAWERIADKVKILRSREPVEVPGGTLFPAPLTEKYSQQNPTAAIDARSATGITIGLAHGTVQGIQQGTLDYPIPRDAPQQYGLDYLAIGHWHSYAAFPATDGSVRMAYSGTHETTKFGERDSGQVLLVDIAVPRAVPKVTPLRTGGFKWEQLRRTIREPNDVRRLCEEIEAWLEPAKTLLDLRLDGLVVPSMQGELLRLEELTAARFCYSRCDSSLLVPSPQDERWVEELPAGVLRNTAASLRQWSDPAAVRPEGVSSVVATRALMELYRYWREAQG